ncbi:aminopeptidase P family protein [Clostridium aciditolerans]|uniref:Aminopeptidase P family protein n=1 Tax=Clostridium aciditolerans TaxID=339861 RepID=A0A934HY67_9CLOT|nr:aminopeptidase P family protein [Clostridium aciditolerans]MBI6872702.1 aminopeptidase P family protein [Clostridium aciditolerans]
MSIKERVNSLREKMKEKGIYAYIVPSSDAHQSEYVAEHWKSRQWISGFTGSAGTAVITLDDAGLWADGRYFIQAEKQLEGSGIKLFKMGQPSVPTIEAWLSKVVPQNGVVGFDGSVLSTSLARNIEKAVSKKGTTLEHRYDLIDELWKDRPSISTEPIFVHDVKYAGKSRVEKVRMVREEMKKDEATHLVLSSLDDIAWLLNIRGTDVPCNPVAVSYVVVSEKETVLFINPVKVKDEVKKELEQDGIVIKAYEDVNNYLKTLAKESKVMLDPVKTSFGICKGLNEGIEIIEKDNITTKIKGIKNEVEIENIKNAHIKDGVAMVKFLHWLDNNLGKEEISEISSANKLESFRAEQELYKGISFTTIAGYKEHAAMMHYSATPESDYKLKKEGMFLLDSGGQYLDGTTDITRTMVLGTLTEEEKRDFTLVVRGVIDLSMARFLHGVNGTNLDILARRPLWEHGIDYKCGTGHGVGFFLNVHEGPHAIRCNVVPTVLEEGMIVTNEPGVYKEGRHGIRTENILLVVKDEETEFGQFMKFETITFCPIDLEGIVPEMLTSEERAWLNNYHKEVYNKLSPYLNEEEKVWLKHKTREI